MAKMARDNWVDTLLQEMATGKKYKRLIQQCINNIGENKRLYKYYDLDSPYTIPNIENSENYYSDPTSFNDPFDCNVGISADQLIRLCLPSVYDQLFDTSLDPPVRNMIESLLFGETVAYDEDSDEAVIEDFLSCPDITDIIHRARAGEEINDDTILSALLNNPNILALMLSKYPGIKEQENRVNLEDQIKIVATKSVKLVRQILIKESANQTGETKEIWAIMSEDEDLLIRLQKIARLTGHGEQDDQIKKVYDQLDNMVKQLHRKIGEIIGITCFSETPNNMLMWSHYANKHTGICVEYDFSRLFTTAKDTLLFPVTYSNNRPLFPVDKIALAENGAVVKNQSVPTEVLTELIKAWTIKSPIWRYEREWRHIIFTNNVPDRRIKLPIISKIIMGVNISPENKQKVTDVAKKKQIPVYSTHMKSSKYEMVISSSPE